MPNHEKKVAPVARNTAVSLKLVVHKGGADYVFSQQDGTQRDRIHQNSSLEFLVKHDARLKVDLSGDWFTSYDVGVTVMAGEKVVYDGRPNGSTLNNGGWIGQFDFPVTA